MYPKYFIPGCDAPMNSVRFVKVISCKEYIVVYTDDSFHTCGFNKYSWQNYRETPTLCDYLNSIEIPVEEAALL